MKIQCAVFALSIILGTSTVCTSGKNPPTTDLHKDEKSSQQSKGQVTHGYVPPPRERARHPVQIPAHVKIVEPQRNVPAHQ